MRCRQTLVLSAMLLLAVATGSVDAQNLPKPVRIWSVAKFAKSDPVMGISFGADGATVTTPHVSSQTSSIFSATRSIVFVGDRIVLVSMIGMRRVEGAQAPESVYQLLSLDSKSGKVKDTRQLSGFGSTPLFATRDGHIIAAGRTLMKLTPDLKDAGNFDYHSTGHKFGNVENVSPDGLTLGNSTNPGFDLIDTSTLKARQLTPEPSYSTSVSNKGFVTNNVRWSDYPADAGFVTYTDITGSHHLYHGDCSGRPQFLTDDLIFVPGCHSPVIIDTHGNLVRTLRLDGTSSYAGVSQDGKRFALQIFSQKKERFIIYSTETGEAITEVEPDEVAEEQSWTAFSPDASMFIVGSPLRLTLYRLP
jgi:hypothetical protein